MKCIILAGGSGDRLWPLSRKNYPKQFLNLNGENSLFQQTITRNIPFCDGFYIITNADYRMIVEGQMKQFQGISYQILLEEEAKGTAPALALIAGLFSEDTQLLVIPSDLFIQGDGYSDAIYRAKELAQEDKMVLFGIRAEEPSTIFGYIRYEGESVSRFIEKPSAALAERIFSDDNILWNSGMLLTGAGVLRCQIEKYAPGLYAWARKTLPLLGTEMGCRVISKEMTKPLSRTHIEKALLEQSDVLAVVPLRCSWVDISNFDTYEKLNRKQREGNIIVSSCENTSVINASPRQLIVANHLKDIMVVGTGDAVYITDRENAQDIKGIIAGQQENRLYREYFDYSPMVYRQWGTREVVAQEPGYRVRKLTIYPGETLTSHIHKKRNENYSIVKGILSVELEQGVKQVGAGESINILPDTPHRLFNDTDQPVIAVEVDTGDEINEQDMLRTEELVLSGQQEQEDSGVRIPHILRLSPTYKDYLWGGDRLKTAFGKDSPYEVTAESWELSAHPDGQSVISGGTFDGMRFGEFVKEHGSAVCGWKSKTFDRFPILIKFIDAAKPLSIQVHPFDDYAFVNEDEFGKNEMWYVMDAEPGAYLYCGFAEEVTREEVSRRIRENTITEILNRVEVHRGDVIFIPAGTIHAIGEGILICEIQQNSNSTYRVYDYDRTDAAGRKRPLHIRKALDVLQTGRYKPEAYGLEEPVRDEAAGNVSQKLCLCKYFECSRYEIQEKISLYLDDSSFVSLVFLRGEGRIICGEESMEASAGDSFFVSAGRKVVHVEGRCEFIATNI